MFNNLWQNPFVVGAGWDKTFIWNVVGGTTDLKFYIPQNGGDGVRSLMIGWGGGHGQLNISGPGTVFTNSNWTYVGAYNSLNALRVANSAKMYSPERLMKGWGSSGNRIIVDGGGSERVEQLPVGELAIGADLNISGPYAAQMQLGIGVDTGTIGPRRFGLHKGFPPALEIG